MYPNSIEKTEAVWRVMVALYECLAIEASRYTPDNEQQRRDAAFAYRAALGALTTLRNAKKATDTARHAADSSCRERAASLKHLMENTLYAALGLVADTKQSMDDIEEVFAEVLKAKKAALAAAIAKVDGMTPEKARHFHDEARAFGDDSPEAATILALKCMDEEARIVSIVTKRLRDAEGIVETTMMEWAAKRAVIARDPRLVSRRVAPCRASFDD